MRWGPAKSISTGPGSITRSGSRKNRQRATHRRQAPRGPCRRTNPAGPGQTGGRAMKVFLAALLFAAIAAVGVSLVLNTIQQPSSIAFTTGGARVGDPGNNLIGPS